MALFLASHWENGWAVMEIKGALDPATARELRDFAGAATARQKRPLHLIADLSELTTVDVDALDSLVSARTLLAENGGELRLVCPEGHVGRSLQAGGLARILPVYPSLDAALAVPRTVASGHTGRAAR
ncbi:STAS domain-containing protein [Streptomyces naphthomycinicus]|uniref:STAS domain-containing protein n=1 Tax=Streptomyces naphthomycinicus TaxID=2872625 RepID=UPI001CEE06FE|nr:STAS domain-containing protein [Streptomyces sp. TML10]